MWCVGKASLMSLCAFAPLAFSSSNENTPNWNDNLRWSVDVASRSVAHDEDSFLMNVLGFDMHRVFSANNRDIATLTFQPYIVNFSGKSTTPYYFDGHDTELTWRIANFNYHALSNGAMDIRVGHFEVPFGLEQNIDTNGTIRQYSFAERGIKADWGASVNGVLSGVDYEMSLTRGSGNDISSRDDPYVFAGRIGMPSTNNLIVGGSFFEGRVLGPNGSIRKKRLGLDAAWYHKHWELLGEFTVGDDAGSTRQQALVEVSWRNRPENLHIYSQFRRQRQELEAGTDTGSSFALGVGFSVTRQLSISSQWSTVLNRLGAQKSESELAVQLRYRL